MADATAATAPAVAGFDSDLITKDTAAVALTAGQVVYKASDGFRLADADALATALAVGIVLASVAAGETATVAEAPTRVSAFTDLTKGAWYAVSATAGKACPVADITATKYLRVLGWAESATTLRLVDNYPVLIPGT